MKDFNIFKIEYYWYEGEHKETLLAKEIEPEKFEEDLIEANKFAESLIGIEIKDYDYLGKGYTVECLPQFYEQIVWFLINKKGYVLCSFDKNTFFRVEDSSNNKKISIIKLKKTIKSNELKSKKEK